MGVSSLAAAGASAYDYRPENAVRPSALPAEAPPLSSGLPDPAVPRTPGSATARTLDPAAARTPGSATARTLDPAVPRTLDPAAARTPGSVGLRPRGGQEALPALTLYRPNGAVQNTFFKPDGFANPASPDIASPFGTQKADEIRCQTCANRKYQDVSSDSGVSFQAPRHIPPGASAAIVASHEREHVARETGSAHRNDQVITKMNVRLFTDICPECGRVYVSGGMTQFAKKAKQDTISEELLGALFDGLA